MKIRSVIVLAFSMCIVAGGASPGPVVRVSVNSAGEEANGWSFYPSVSSDGRFVAFLSRASNLVANDTNEAYDVFVHDRQTGHTRCASLNQNRIPAGGFWARISADGRYVVFASRGMLTNDTYTYQGQLDTYVWDAQTGLVTRENILSDGRQAQAGPQLSQPAISADGRYVVMSGGYNFLSLGRGVFLRDRLLKTTEKVDIAPDGTPANGESEFAWVSDDGRYVSFSSRADNLASGDGNSNWDIFLKDRSTRETILVSRKTNGLSSGITRTSRVSGDGSCVVFDTSGRFMWPPDPGQQVYRYDIATRSLSRPLSLVGGPAYDVSRSSVSADGRMVAIFASDPNLVVGDANGTSETFLWDSLTGSIRFGPGPIAADFEIGPDGRTYAFNSTSSDLVIGDNNGVSDVFVQDMGLPTQLVDIRLTRSTLAGRNRTLGILSLDQAVRQAAPFVVSEDSPQVSLHVLSKFVAGSDQAKFAVLVAPVVTSTTVIIKARFGSQELTTPLVLVPLIPSAFQFTPRHVIGGASLSARIVLNGVADATGLVLTLADDNGLVLTPSTIAIAGGATQGTCTIITLPVTATQYVAVTASIPHGACTGHFVVRP